MGSYSEENNQNIGQTEKMPEVASQKPPKANRKRLLALGGSTLALVIVLVVVILVAGGFGIDHISPNNPQFCASCHVMDEYVESYTNSIHLDNLHMKANVGCKDCHSDYTIPNELASAVAYVSGNYIYPFEQIRVENTMCFQCHIDEEHLGNKTDFLYRNPHRNHNLNQRCTTCHLSHQPQFDFCSQCHENGGQRMLEDPVVEPRIFIPAFK